MVKNWSRGLDDRVTSEMHQIIAADVVSTDDISVEVKQTSCGIEKEQAHVVSFREKNRVRAREAR